VRAIVEYQNAKDFMDVAGVKSLLSQIADVSIDDISARHPEVQLLMGVSVDELVRRLTLLIAADIVDRRIEWCSRMDWVVARRAAAHWTQAASAVIDGHLESVHKSEAEASKEALVRAPCPDVI